MIVVAVSPKSSRGIQLLALAMGVVVEFVVSGRGCMCINEMSMFPLCSPAVIAPNEYMMIGMSMYTHQLVSRMDPVVDAAPETLLFRSATLGIIILWNQPYPGL